MIRIVLLLLDSLTFKFFLPGDHDVCRSLARIAASVCSACKRLSREGRHLQAGPGLLDLLKAASHPSVNICGIALEVLSELVESEVGLGNQLLPILQRRAITPHRFSSDGIPSLIVSDVCGANFDAFDAFRNGILVDALVACWKSNTEHYLASCTAAIEEFCGAASSATVSFHLEAALFCMTAVADEAMGQSEDPVSHSPFLARSTRALAGKPKSLTSNPLTLIQACAFVKKVSLVSANDMFEILAFLFLRKISVRKMVR